MYSSSPRLPDTTPDANLTQRNAWTLDKLGNWDEFLKRTNGTEVTEPRTNNKANEYLTMDPDGSGGASPLTLAHDHNGNLTDDGTYLYDYDIENRMTRVTLKSGPTVLAEYHYDALGRRIRKIIPSGQPGAGTWTYFVNELWQVVSEYWSGGSRNHVRRYVHAGRSAYVDDHVAMWDIASGNLYYYHADAQFCTVAMTNSSGAVAERYVTDPYGKAVTYNASWASPQATSRLGNPFMHQGLWLNGEGNSYEIRFRMYSVSLGRFAERDLLQYYDSANLYQWLNGNATNSLDPSGLMAQKPPGWFTKELIEQYIKELWDKKWLQQYGAEAQNEFYKARIAAEIRLLEKNLAYLLGTTVSAAVIVLTTTDEARAQEPDPFWDNYVPTEEDIRQARCRSAGDKCNEDCHRLYPIANDGWLDDSNMEMRFDCYHKCERNQAACIGG